MKEKHRYFIKLTCHTTETMYREIKFLFLYWVHLIVGIKKIASHTPLVRKIVPFINQRETFLGMYPE